MGTKSKWLKGKLTFYNNAVVEENVASYTSTVTSIPPYGLRVLNPGGNKSYKLSGGPAIGQELEIVCISTFVTSVRVSTAIGGVTIDRPTASTDAHGVIVTAAGSTAGNYPGAATLRGISTSQWMLVKGYSTGWGGCTLSTSLT